jgi:hypothetical protein
MPDVDTLFRDYVAEHRAGGRADPSGYLEQLEGTDRRELAALIEGYLARAPGRAWDAGPYAGSPAERTARSIAAKWDEWELADEPQPWTELLPALRNRARVKRRELVERLAEAIGFPADVERVGAYYHQMETGSLPSEGVSGRVLSALGELLGESAERLRAAGSAIGAGADREQVASQVAFARTATRDPAYEGTTDQSVKAKASSDAVAEPDEVDRLFTGGPEATG